MTRPPPSVIQNIQALRGVAALFVFLAHIKGAEGEYGGAGDLLPGWLYMGVTGVDLFFLISGFVMVHVAGRLEPGPATSARFLFNRAGRIYPLYWLVTIALLILYAGKKALFGEDTPIPNFIASFLLTPSPAYPIVPVGWTLVHEMYFYVVFALIILAPQRLWLALLALWGAVVAAGSMTGAIGANAWTQVAFNPLTAEFLIGAGLAFLVKRGITAFAAPALGIGAVWLAILIFGFSGLYPETMGDFAKRALIFAPPYALILYGAVAIEARSGRTAARWLIYTGDASYALYLVHVPVFLVVGKVLSELIPDDRFDNIALVGGYTLAGLAAAYVAHEFAEKPLLQGSRRIAERLFGKSAPPPFRAERAW